MCLSLSFLPRTPPLPPPCSFQPKEMELDVTEVFVRNRDSISLKFVSPFCFCGQCQDAEDGLCDISVMCVADTVPLVIARNVQ